MNPATALPGAIARGAILVLGGPSGCGKSTVLDALMLRRPRLGLLPSVTTRPRRPGERPAIDYHYTDDEGFDELARRGELVQSVEVYGRRYGTLKRDYEMRLAAGREIGLVMVAEGLGQVRAAFPGDVLSVFLLPPSREELARRLAGRGAGEALDRRLAEAEAEIATATAFDRQVINADLAACVARVADLLDRR